MHMNVQMVNTLFHTEDFENYQNIYKHRGKNWHRPLGFCNFILHKHILHHRIGLVKIQ